MNVQQFVKETLVQALRGVHDAQVEVQKEGVGQVARGTRAVFEVAFDIAIVATEESEQAGGLQVAGFGGRLSSTAREESTSRIQFKVPIIYPQTS